MNSIVKNIHEKNQLNDLFFDKVNIEALQHGIRYLVYNATCKKHIIGNQDERQLLLVMRSIYLQYSYNLDFELLEQVKTLNSKVLDYCVDKIVSELKMYDKYLSDINTISIPSNPISTNKSGLKNIG